MRQPKPSLLVSLTVLVACVASGGGPTTRPGAAATRPGRESPIQQGSPEWWLFEAVRTNDLKSARSLLAQGADPNQAQVLFIAPSRAMAELLIARGADVRARERGSRGATPLFYAAFRGDPELVALLLEKGADVNAGDRVGFTPLHNAVCSTAPVGDVHTVVGLLVECGADVEAREKFERSTPLHVAAFVGNYDGAAELVLRGADVRAKQKDGKTPIEVARERGSAAVESLLSRAATGQPASPSRDELKAIEKSRSQFRWQQRQQQRQRPKSEDER